MKIWIAQIEISRAVERKIRSKHYLTAHEIRASIVTRSDILAYMDIHPVHGQRIVIRATALDGKTLLAWQCRPRITWMSID